MGGAYSIREISGGPTLLEKSVGGAYSIREISGGGLLY